MLQGADLQGARDDVRRVLAAAARVAAGQALRGQQEEEVAAPVARAQ